MTVVHRVSIAVLLLLAGCASELDSPDEAGWTLQESLLDTDSRGAVDRLANAVNGLELRKWLIVDDPDRIATVIARHGEPATLPDEQRHRLRRNGFRFWKVPADELQAVLDSLAGASVDVRGWHGQMLQWRPIHEMPLGRQRLTLAVDGRVHRYDGGTFALMARSWTVQMEDGPHLQLELVPEHRSGPRRTDLRVLLGQSAPPRQRFATLGCDARLERGSAYLLTCETPGREWSPETPAAGEEMAIGPEAAAPLTLGQMLLTSRHTPPERGMLVFLPRIASELYPPELAPP